MVNDDENAKIPFRPLLEKWLNTGKTKADFARGMGDTQAVITNWIARGYIPEGKLRKAVALVGMKPDDYLIEIGVLQPPRPQKEPINTMPLLDEWRVIQKEVREVNEMQRRIAEEQARQLGLAKTAKAKHGGLERGKGDKKKHGGLK